MHPLIWLKTRLAPLLLPSRNALRRALKDQYAVLQALRVTMHPDKTLIGPVVRGFDLLGFHSRPTGVRVSDASLSQQDRKLARLDEQDVSQRRIARYLALWIGWAGFRWRRRASSC